MKEHIARKQNYFPYNTKQDYNPFAKTNVHTKSVHCTYCYGSGGYRARSHPLTKYMDPRITIKLCQHCKGRGRVWVRPGSEMDKKSQQIVAGLWENKGYKVRRR